MGNCPYCGCSLSAAESTVGTCCDDCYEALVRPPIAAEALGNCQYCGCSLSAAESEVGTCCDNCYEAYVRSLSAAEARSKCAICGCLAVFARGPRKGEHYYKEDRKNCRPQTTEGKEIQS